MRGERRKSDDQKKSTKQESIVGFFIGYHSRQHINGGCHTRHPQNHVEHDEGDDAKYDDPYERKRVFPFRYLTGNDEELRRSSLTAIFYINYFVTAR